jgi:hypothetical protein
MAISAPAYTPSQLTPYPPAQPLPAQGTEAQPTAFDPTAQPLTATTPDTFANPFADPTAAQPAPPAGAEAPPAGIDQAALDQAMLAYAQLQQAPPADASQAGIAVDPSQLGQQPPVAQEPTANADPFAPAAAPTEPTAPQPTQEGVPA